MNILADLDLKKQFGRNKILSTFSSYLPTSIKDIFHWCEFIVSNVPIAAAGIKKLSEVPVTNFKYYVHDDFNETNKTIATSWKSILEDKLGLKSTMLEISYNLRVYGNVFVSVYKPHIRLVQCSVCGTISEITTKRDIKVALAPAAAFKPARGKKRSSADESANLQIDKHSGKIVIARCMCNKCKQVTPHLIKDKPDNDPSRANIILWNPHAIDIEHNRITGTSRYYYTPEQIVIDGVKSGSMVYLETLPLELIETVLSNKKFVIDNSKIYHGKKNKLAGVTTVWGIPDLVSAIPVVLTYLIYNKANEKIASDYLVPLRTVFPANSTGAGDVYNYVSGTEYADKLAEIINRWKIDSSSVQITPFPVGTQQILGDGKMLNLDSELQNKEIAIANTLGVPIEFIKGGLSYSAQGPSLRLLENQLAKHKYDLDRIIDFIVQEIASFTKKDPVKVELLPFKIIDDLQEKAAIIQLATQGGGIISTGTLLELFNMDANTERKRNIEEQKAMVKEQLELQRYQQQVQTSLEEKARAEEALSRSSFNQLNQQALMQEAETYVEQLLQLDEGERKSRLDELAKTNYILYATVKALMEMKTRKAIYMAGKQALKGGEQ